MYCHVVDWRASSGREDETEEATRERVMVIIVGSFIMRVKVGFDFDCWLGGAKSEEDLPSIY